MTSIKRSSPGVIAEPQTLTLSLLPRRVATLVSGSGIELREVEEAIRELEERLRVRRRRKTGATETATSAELQGPAVHQSDETERVATLVSGSGIELREVEEAIRELEERLRVRRRRKTGATETATSAELQGPAVHQDWDPKRRDRVSVVRPTCPAMASASVPANTQPKLARWVATLVSGSGIELREVEEAIRELEERLRVRRRRKTGATETATSAELQGPERDPKRRDRVSVVRPTCPAMASASVPANTQPKLARRVATLVSGSGIELREVEEAIRELEERLRVRRRRKTGATETATSAELQGPAVHQERDPKRRDRVSVVRPTCPAMASASVPANTQPKLARRVATLVSGSGIELREVEEAIRELEERLRVRRRRKTGATETATSAELQGPERDPKRRDRVSVVRPTCPAMASASVPANTQPKLARPLPRSDCASIDEALKEAERVEDVLCQAPGQTACPASARLTATRRKKYASSNDSRRYDEAAATAVTSQDT
ncbi:hypothetical protein AAFF_G00377210 [Aldrovandia affinis]|uniref:Uncharacterized protein n=1 Tax=Aldrovandia affinis TaxID=143900 RepID=A0AAD7SFP8_9TELE|nr:hypothetical protein AAFF_G00377210 [Aldrovandia affinis]